MTVPVIDNLYWLCLGTHLSRINVERSLTVITQRLNDYPTDHHYDYWSLQRDLYSNIPVSIKIYSSTSISDIDSLSHCEFTS